jgi:hypothetical protein
MSLSFGRPALPCVLGGLGAITGFFVADAGTGSMPFGFLIDAAIAGRTRPISGRCETTRDPDLVDEWARGAEAMRRCQFNTVNK